jgi:hypothetical protein
MWWRSEVLRHCGKLIELIYIQKRRQESLMDQTLRAESALLRQLYPVV